MMVRWSVARAYLSDYCLETGLDPSHHRVEELQESAKGRKEQVSNVGWVSTGSREINLAGCAIHQVKPETKRRAHDTRAVRQSLAQENGVACQ